MNKESLSTYPEEQESIIMMDAWKTVQMGLLIFTILIAFYLFTYSGIPRIEDEQIIAARAQSFVLWDEFTFPQLYGNDRIRHLAIASPEQANFDVSTDLGQSFLAAQLFQLASTFNTGGTQVAMTANIYLTALTGVVVFLTLSSMKYKPRTAVVSGLIFGLATMVWPYSKTLFRDGLLMFVVSIVFLGFSYSIRKSSKLKYTGYTLMVFGIVGALLAKRTAWILIPALLFVLLILDTSVVTKKQRARLLIVSIAGMLAMVLLVFFLPSEGILARFSLPHFKFVLQRMINGLGEATLQDYLGPFLSPGKSVFLFSPILLLVPVGLLQGWKRHKSIYAFGLVTIGLLVLAQVLFYREVWAGIPIWGLRFMLLTLPIFILFSAPIIERTLQTKARVLRGLFFGLLGVSVLIQVAGSVVKWTVPLIEWSERGWDPYAYQSVWNIASSPIPIHFTALFDPTNFDMAWFRTLPQESSTLIIPLILLMSIGCGVFLLVHVFKRNSGSWILILLAVGLGVMGFILPISSLTLLRYDPGLGGDHPEYETMLNWVETHIEPGDLVIMDSYGTSLWSYMINRWNTSEPWYSLPFDYSKAADASLEFDETPSQAFDDLISKKKQSHQRVLYILTSDTPGFPFSAELKYLETRFPFDEAVRLSGHTIVEMRIFSMGE